MLDFLLFSLLIFFLFVFLGLGLSFLLCPVKFEKYSLFFAPFIGISYLTFSGWLLAHYDIGGVNTFWPYVFIPSVLFLLLSIFWKKQRIFEIFWPFRRENLLLPIICLIVYLCISYPFMTKFDYLTVISLGNNDIVFYAAVAKFLTYSSLSHVDPFLNPQLTSYAGNIETQFPTGLSIGYACSVLGVEPYQILTIILNLFFMFSVAFAFIISYELFSYSKTFSFILAFLTGFSFHLIYIVYEGFFAQVLGTGLFLALSFVIYYPILFDNQTMKSYVKYLPFAVILAFGLVTFYKPFGPLFVAPLLVFLAIRIITEKSIVNIKNEFLYLLSVLFFTVFFLSIMFYPSSILDLLNRYIILNDAVIGWNFPILSPDWIFGLVGFNTGMAQTSLIPRSILSVIILIICLYSMKSLYTDNKKLFFFSASNLIFVLIFYIYLISKEEMSLSFTGEGYKAYKLITYFLPIILISCLYYFKNFQFNFSQKDIKTKIIVFGLLGLLLVGNTVSAVSIISTSNERLKFISQDIIDLRTVDKFENVTSINIQIPPYWDQMWVYYFLFDKHRLYLKYPSYYTASPQNGEWTLKEKDSDILSVLNFTKASNTILINNVYYLEKNSSCDISFYKGWYDLESNQDVKWRWSGKKNETPSLEINCIDEEQSVNMKLNYYSQNQKNSFSILIDGKKISTCSNKYCEITNMNFSKGKHILSFDATIPPQLPGINDPRYLGYSYSKILISKNE